jgi:hypothetical protein
MNGDHEWSTYTDEAGDAGDTVLRETGEKKRMSGRSYTGVMADITPFIQDTHCCTSCDAAGSARSTCSEMPVGRRGCWFCGGERQFNPALPEAQSI